MQIERMKMKNLRKKIMGYKSKEKAKKNSRQRNKGLLCIYSSTSFIRRFSFLAYLYSPGYKPSAKRIKGEKGRLKIFFINFFFFSHRKHESRKKGARDRYETFPWRIIHQILIGMKRESKFFFLRFFLARCTFSHFIASSSFASSARR